MHRQLRAISTKVLLITRSVFFVIKGPNMIEVPIRMLNRAIKHFSSSATVMAEGVLCLLCLKG